MTTYEISRTLGLMVLSLLYREPRAGERVDGKSMEQDLQSDRSRHFSQSPSKETMIHGAGVWDGEDGSSVFPHDRDHGSKMVFP